MLKLPVRLPVHHGSPAIEYHAKNIWGTSLKFAIRECAKQLPEYHMPIIIEGYETEPLTVKADNGKTITINTLGKWIFGTPGYMGHVIVDSFKTDKIVVHYPELAPPEIPNLLKKAIEMLIQSSQCK